MRTGSATTVMTGASGFIGSRLAARLKSFGHNIVKVPHSDIGNYPSQFDYLFFLSAYGNHHNQRDDYETYEANVEDLFCTLYQTKDVEYKAFIHFSTSSVTLAHQTLYSATKCCAEELITAFRNRYHKPVVSVRPYSVYGPGEGSHRFIPTIIRSITKQTTLTVTPGEHDWIYVDDFIDGVVAVSENIESITHPVGIGSGRGTDNLDVVAMVEELMGNSTHKKVVANLREYDTDRWVCEDTQLNRLGWHPKHTLREGLRKTVKQYE